MIISTFNKVNEDAIIDSAIAILEKRLTKVNVTTLSAPDTVVQYLMLRLAQLEHEVFGCLFLTVKNQLILDVKMFRGSLTHGSVYPREVVKEALACNAASVIFYHNHPSGDVIPSSADIEITKQLKTACELMDVRTLDHVIIAGSCHYSFAKQGLL